MSLHSERFLSEVEHYLTEAQVSELYSLCEELEDDGTSVGATAATVVSLVVRYALENAGVKPTVKVSRCSHSSVCGGWCSQHYTETAAAPTNEVKR